jgi:AcrR family transcriptional regulator
MPASAQQVEQAVATRATLLAAARELFGTQGYFDTGTEQIVIRAAVTRGALYHHFADKKALFEAVFEEVESELVHRLTGRAPQGANAWGNFCSGAQMLLDMSLEPAVQRIILLDGPAALGWDVWRKLKDRYALAFIEAAIHEAIDEGTIPRQPATVLAHMISAAVTAGAMLIVNAPDPKTTRAEAGESLDRLLNGLRSAAGTGRG